MKYVTFISRLEKRLQKMADDELLRFGTEICKRLYPGYATFAVKHQWGDTNLLLDAIRACDRPIAGIVDVEMVNDLRRRIDAVIPDTEEFGDFDGSYALHASAAMAYVLQFVLDKSPENMKHVATLYYDNTDTKLQEQGITNEVEQDRHPQMEETLRFLLDE